MEIIFLDREDGISFLGTSKVFLNYFNNLDYRTLPKKTGNSNIDINHYLDNIVNFSEANKKLITKIIKTLLPHPLVYGKWEFVKIDPKIELGWPFTIENKIIVSDNILGEYNNHLLYTLAHERIHTLQYKYPSLFEEVINNMGFIYLPIKIDPNFITNYLNPDGMQLSKKSYAYLYKENFYVPLMILENNSIKKYSYKIRYNKKGYYLDSNKKDIKHLTKLFGDCDHGQCYHPNEILADVGGNYILGKKINNTVILGFLDHLTDYVFKYHV